MWEQQALTGWVCGMLNAEANQSAALQSCAEWCHCRTEGRGEQLEAPKWFKRCRCGLTQMANRVFHWAFLSSTILQYYSLYCIQYCNMPLFIVNYSGLPVQCEGSAWKPSLLNNAEQRAHPVSTSLKVSNWQEGNDVKSTGVSFDSSSRLGREETPSSCS